MFWVDLVLDSLRVVARRINRQLQMLLAYARDSCDAFGLGAIDTRVSTIEADGIALAAIKAQIEQNYSLAHR